MSKIKEQEGLKLRGHIKATVNKGMPNEKIVLDHHNTIQTDIRSAIIDAMSAEGTPPTFNLDLANRFDEDATPPATGKHCIIIYDGTNWYSCTTLSVTQPSAYSMKVTSDFTGVAGTFSNASLGQSYSGGGADFDINYATPTSWTNVTLDTNDILTIEWTLSI